MLERLHPQRGFVPLSEPRRRCPAARKAGGAPWLWDVRLAVFPVVLILGLTAAERAQGVTGCRQPTPHPYQADGACHPYLEWGYSKTRWRPWPGEAAARPAGPELADDGPGAFDALVLPKPSEEDLKGPQKKKQPKSADADAAEISAPLPGADLLPGLEAEGSSLEGDDFLDLDPQGYQQRPPRWEDGPPTLPGSLRPVISSHPARAPRSQDVRVIDPAVTPASWNQPARPAAPALVNPAAVLAR